MQELSHMTEVKLVAIHLRSKRPGLDKIEVFSTISCTIRNSKIGDKIVSNIDHCCLRYTVNG